MSLSRTGKALVGLAVVAAAVAGCGGPTVRPVESAEPGTWKAEHTARFVDGAGEKIAGVNLTRNPLNPPDGMLEVGIQVAHREGTTLESLEIEFLPGLFTPVYLDSPNHWLDGMEFLKQDGVATLRVPEVGRQGIGTVTYTFLIPQPAIAEQDFREGTSPEWVSGMPLTVRFTLDGTEAIARLELKPEATFEVADGDDG